LPEKRKLGNRGSNVEIADGEIRGMEKNGPGGKETWWHVKRL